jgi:hypothetical protein
MVTSKTLLYVSKTYLTLLSSFSDDYLSKGRCGGRLAALDLHERVRTFVSQGQDQAAPSPEILIMVFQ